jgi:methyl-accepting chemotaxis protein
MEETSRATAELEATLFRVGQDARASVKAGQTTSESAAVATQCVSELAGCADRIGSVSDAIRNIASQTSLLALNATIEAARAGQAGKGFAVVAVEVKSLAERTAQATRAVAADIQQIQAASQRSAEALRSVVAAIECQTEIGNRIGSAVIAQASSTGQIRQEAASVAEAACASAGSVAEIQETLAQLQNALDETSSWARAMSTHSQDLGREFGYFANSERSA